jgi:hypothetical protein
MSLRKSAVFFGLFIFVFLAPVLTGQFPAGQQMGGQPQAQFGDDITYTMPPGWIIQPVQGAGANVRVHYVYYQGGIPYCEMYLFCDPLAQTMTLDQAFQQGVERARPTLQGYQPLATQKTQVAGQETVVHDFSYFVSGSVSFIGRSYVMLVNNNLYNFFFNTTNTYFYSLQGIFAQIVSTVRVVPRPAPGIQPGIQPGVQLGGQMGAPVGGMQAGGMTVQEQDFTLDLAPGWGPSNDPAGAKYRWYNQNGQQLGAFFIFEPDQGGGMATLFGDVSPSSLLDAAFEKQKTDLFQTLGNYAPINTVKTKIGGFDALVHDFNFAQGQTTGYYRWYFIVHKPKADEGTTRYGTYVYPFGFMTTALNQLEMVKSQFDAIMGSIRPKGAPAPPARTATPPPPPPANAAGAPPVAPPVQIQRPQEKPAVGGLPTLTPETGTTATYQDAAGRFKIPLPAGTKIFRKEGDLTSYQNREKNAYFQIWTAASVEKAEGIELLITEKKKLNGKPVKWDVGGTEAIIKLYSGKNTIGDDVAVLTAFYPKAALVLLIEVPAKAYAADQEWISGLIRGVQFLK